MEDEKKTMTNETVLSEPLSDETKIDGLTMDQRIRVWEKTGNSLGHFRDAITMITTPVERIKVAPDDVTEFIRDWCEKDETAKIPTRAMYEAFAHYCQTIGATTNHRVNISGRDFNTAVRDLGYEITVGSQNKTYVHGLKIRS